MNPKTGMIAAAIVIVVISIVLIAAISATIGTYNDLVNKEESIDGSWAQVENRYQQKIDLIPTLISTVESYQEFEGDTLTNITALRTRWMEADSTDEQVQISSDLDMAINVMFEAYPTLLSIEAVEVLMVNMDTMEAQIATERMRYNEDVKDYNAKIRQFPTVLVANMFGFEKRAYYESSGSLEQPGM